MFWVFEILFKRSKIIYDWRSSQTIVIIWLTNAQSVFCEGKKEYERTWINKFSLGKQYKNGNDVDDRSSFCSKAHSNCCAAKCLLFCHFLFHHKSLYQSSNYQLSLLCIDLHILLPNIIQQCGWVTNVFLKGFPLEAKNATKNWN